MRGLRAHAWPRVTPRVAGLLALLLLAALSLQRQTARGEVAMEENVAGGDGLVELAGRRYYFSGPDQMLNWTSAQLFCRSRGLQLASLEERAENERVKQQAGARNLTDDLYFIWLGGVDEAARDTSATSSAGRPRRLVWSGSGRPLEGFSDWHEGEPNRGNRDKFSCLAMWRYGDVVAWGLEECAETSFFVCEQAD